MMRRKFRGRNSKRSMKKFAKKVLKADSMNNGWIKVHWNDRAGTAITQNQQAFYAQYVCKNMPNMINLYNLAAAQLPGGVGAFNPAIMYVKERSHVEVYNTGTSVLFMKLNLWRCRDDIFQVTGKTDSLANIIADGITKVPIVAATGFANFASTEPGYNLFHNPLWCKHFKALKSYNFTLLPGARKSFYHKLSYKFDATDTPTSGTDTIGFQKGQLFLAGFAFGQPAFDANAHALPTAIGSAAGALITYNLNDAEVTLQTNSNKMVGQRTTTFNMATAGTVYQPIASAEPAVAVF